MPTPAHQIVDVISRFIGELQIAIEDARQRAEPEQANGDAPPLDRLDIAEGEELPFDPGEIDIGGVEGSDYVIEDDPGGGGTLIIRKLNIPRLEIPQLRLTPDDEHPIPGFRVLIADADQPLGPMPPQVAAAIQQMNFLFDEDILFVGHGDIAAPAPIRPIEQLAELEAIARESGGGLVSLDPAYHDIGKLADFTIGTHKLVAAAENATASGSWLSGLWVNGKVIEDGPPELEDHLPSSNSYAKLVESKDKQDGKDGQDGAVTGKPAKLVLDSSELDTTMEVSSGHNGAINEAKLVGAGVVANTIAVAQNHYSIDVIVQINAITSSAVIDPALAGIFSIDTAQDVLVNLANFSTVVLGEGEDAPELDPDIVPKSWSITIVDDDLIFFNWLYQYNFIADGDTLVLTATGITTTLGTGGNLSINSAGINFMGMAYDLLLIGGSYYDVNYISQLNILYDTDFLSLHNPMPGNAGEIQTGGNVLWNQAEILTLGASEWQEDLPGVYAQTMKDLDKGKHTMPKALSEDKAFAGYEHLNVLYVTGNLFDINYIEQVNIVGDPDQVIFYAEEAFGKNVDWTVHTGGNVLVNTAIIHDHQSSGGSAYVGGTLYSEALLIQTEIIHTGSEQPSQMVNEVIAFLDDEVMPDLEDMAGMLQIAAGNHAPDGLESMLS